MNVNFVALAAPPYTPNKNHRKTSLIPLSSFYTSSSVLTSRRANKKDELFSKKFQTAPYIVKHEGNRKINNFYEDNKCRDGKLISYKNRDKDRLSLSLSPLPSKICVLKSKKELMIIDSQKMLKGQERNCKELSQKVSNAGDKNYYFLDEKNNNLSSVTHKLKLESEIGNCSEVTPNKNKVFLCKEQANVINCEKLLENKNNQVCTASSIIPRHSCGYSSHSPIEKGNMSDFGCIFAGNNHINTLNSTEKGVLLPQKKVSILQDKNIYFQPYNTFIQKTTQLHNAKIRNFNPTRNQINFDKSIADYSQYRKIDIIRPARLSSDKLNFVRIPYTYFSGKKNDIYNGSEQIYPKEKGQELSKNNKPIIRFHDPIAMYHPYKTHYDSLYEEENDCFLLKENIKPSMEGCMKDEQDDHRLKLEILQADFNAEKLKAENYYLLFKSEENEKKKLLKDIEDFQKKLNEEKLKMAELRKNKIKEYMERLNKLKNMKKIKAKEKKVKEDQTCDYKAPEDEECKDYNISMLEVSSSKYSQEDFNAIKNAFVNIGKRFKTFMTDSDNTEMLSLREKDEILMFIKEIAHLHKDIALLYKELYDLRVKYYGEKSLFNLKENKLNEEKIIQTKNDRKAYSRKGRLFSKSVHFQPKKELKKRKNVKNCAVKYNIDAKAVSDKKTLLFMAHPNEIQKLPITYNRTEKPLEPPTRSECKNILRCTQFVPAVGEKDFSNISYLQIKSQDSEEKAFLPSKDKIHFPKEENSFKNCNILDRNLNKNSISLNNPSLSHNSSSFNILPILPPPLPPASLLSVFSSLNGSSISSDYEYKANVKDSVFHISALHQQECFKFNGLQINQIQNKRINQVMPDETAKARFVTKCFNMKEKSNVENECFSDIETPIESVLQEQDSVSDFTEISKTTYIVDSLVCSKEEKQQYNKKEEKQKYNKKEEEQHYNQKKEEQHYNQKKEEQHYNQKKEEQHYNQKKEEQHYNQKKEEQHYNQKKEEQHYNQKEEVGIQKVKEQQYKRKKDEQAKEYLEELKREESMQLEKTKFEKEKIKNDNETEVNEKKNIYETKKSLKIEKLNLKAHFIAGFYGLVSSIIEDQKKTQKFLIKIDYVNKTLVFCNKRNYERFLHISHLRAEKMNMKETFSESAKLYVSGFENPIIITFEKKNIKNAFVDYVNELNREEKKADERKPKHIIVKISNLREIPPLSNVVEIKNTTRSVICVIHYAEEDYYNLEKIRNQKTDTILAKYSEVSHDYNAEVNQQVIVPYVEFSLGFKITVLENLPTGISVIGQTPLLQLNDQLLLNPRVWPLTHCDIRTPGKIEFFVEYSILPYGSFGKDYFPITSNNYFSKKNIIQNSESSILLPNKPDFTKENLDNDKRIYIEEKEFNIKENFSTLDNFVLKSQPFLNLSSESTLEEYTRKFSGEKIDKLVKTPDIGNITEVKKYIGRNTQSQEIKGIMKFTNVSEPKLFKNNMVETKIICQEHKKKLISPMPIKLVKVQMETKKNT